MATEEKPKNTKELEATMKEKAALKFVQEFAKQSKKFTAPYFKKFNILWAEYLNSRCGKPSGGQRANLRLPIAFNVIEKSTPPIVDAFLGDKPYLFALGRTEEDVDYEQDITDTLTWQMDQMKFPLSFITFMKTTGIFGTAIGKIPWRYQTKLRYRKKDVMHPTLDIKIGESKEAYEDVVYDGPAFENVNILDFFPDWASTNPGDIDSMRGCIHRVWRTMDDLELKEKKKNKDGSESGIYTNLDKLRVSLKEKGDNAWANAVDGPAEPDYSSKYGALGQPNGIKEANKFQVWEYWGLFKPPGQKNFMEYTIAVANGDTLIRCDINRFDGQFKPFIGNVCYPVPGEFYGIGDLEPILSLAREMTAMRNARLDQANMAVNRMWIVDRTAGINLRSLYSRGGGVILSNDINGIKALEVPEVPGSGYKETAEIGYDIQDSTTQIDASRGGSNLGSGFGKTATGISFLQNQTSGRLGLRVRITNELLFANLGEKMMMLNRQFLEDDVLIRIKPDMKENPFRRVPLDAFSRKYDYTASGAIERLSHKEQQLNFQNNIVPYLKMVESVRPGTAKLSDITEIYLKLFDIRNPKTLVNDEETQQKIAQAKAQQEMQMEMMKADANAKSQAGAQSMLIDQKTKGDFILQNEKTKGKMAENEQKAAHNMIADEQEVDSKTANEVVKGVVKLFQPKGAKSNGK